MCVAVGRLNRKLAYLCWCALNTDQSVNQLCSVLLAAWLFAFVNKRSHRVQCATVSVYNFQDPLTPPTAITKKEGINNCQFFVIVLKIICSLIRIQALFNNCTIFYLGLEAFYIALGHVNPTGNYYYHYYPRADPLMIMVIFAWRSPLRSILNEPTTVDVRPYWRWEPVL